MINRPVQVLRSGRVQEGHKNCQPLNNNLGKNMNLNKIMVANQGWQKLSPPKKKSFFFCLNALLYLFILHMDRNKFVSP